MRVSVLITNHDYARYLPRAIDSALLQGVPGLEFVVVDDGSSDGSVDVLRSYGERIAVVFQDQRGQAAALNAAFSRSRGDVVCLLDADDWFAPGKVAAVLAALRRRPAALLVHHQMQSVDAGGNPFWRPWPRHLWDGDVSARVARSGGWYPHATCSGLAFTRAYLDRLFPLPTGPWVGRGPLGPVSVELEPDTYLAGPAAFLGPVAAIRRPLTMYRVHGANKLATGGRETAETLNRGIARAAVEFELLRRVLAEGFGRRPPIALEHHLEYQLQRRALRCISLHEALRRTVRSPTLPAAGRAREAVRVAVGRGISRGVPSP
jgi:glycosyltransferase involved in cell wall biosynthesis